MKVVFVSQPMDMVLPPDQNSLGIWTHRTAPEVARAHDVVVVAKRSAAQNAWSGDDGVRYSFVPPTVPNRVVIGWLDRVLRRVGRSRLPAYAWMIAYLDYALRSALICRRERADVIHVFNWTQFVPVIRRLNPDAKIVLHMTGEWLSQLPVDIVDRRLDVVDLVVGCSEYLTDLVVERFPDRAATCITIHNGVDIDRFDAEPSVAGDRHVLFVGRVSPEKGVHDLIEAFVQIASDHPDVTLDLIGPVETLPMEFIVGVTADDDIAALARFYDRDYRDALDDLIPDDLRARVRFLGSMPQTDLIAHYADAAVVANVSYSESFGMSLVEALACRTPVVATRVGGMPGIVGEDASMGILLDRGDIDAIAGALRNLLADEAARAQMGERGRRHVLDHYSWEQIGRSVVTAYDTIPAR